MKNIILKGWNEPLYGHSVCCIDVIINNELVTVWTFSQFIFEHPKRNNEDLRNNTDQIILLYCNDHILDVIVQVNQLHKNHIKKVARKILNVPNNTKVIFK